MQSPFKSTKNKEKIMGTIRDAKTEILRQAFVKERIAFLNMPFHRKVQFVQSYVTFQNGVTFYEIKRIVLRVTQGFEKSLARDLKNISDRKKLTYRQSPNIIKRNNHSAKFLIR